MNSRSTVASTLLFCFVATGCGERAASPPESQTSDIASTAGQPELDCERLGYPCTWGEVLPEVLIRTDELTRKAGAMFDSGTSGSDVAAMLAEEPGVLVLDVDQETIVFRLEGGRPVGIVGSNGVHPGYLQAGATPPGASEATDAVGQDESGKKPSKKALFLEPYLWEFRVAPGDRSGAFDESELVLRRFQSIRDYKNCDSDCVAHFANNWHGDCSGNVPDCGVENNVTLQHFRSWKDYDVIHVTTHGFVWVLNAGKADELMVPAIATGRVIEGDFKRLVESMPEGKWNPRRISWLTETGVELLWVRKPTKLCNKWEGEGLTDSPAYRAWCSSKDFYREYLTLDFFRKHYPRGLQDKLIFLSSCYSIQYDDLAKHLAGPDKSSAVLGWTDLIGGDEAAWAVSEFYRYWIGGESVKGGVKVQAAYEKVKTKFKDLPWGMEGRDDLTLGPSDQPDSPSKRAEWVQEGSKGKRGREIVFLVEPQTGKELQDGGTLQITGSSAQVDFQVIGVDDEDDIDDYEIHLRVDEHTVAKSWMLNQDLGSGVWRRKGPVDLGFEFQEGQVVDIEIWTELPGKGTSRWLYEDVHLGGGCFVQMEVTGAVSGSYLWTGQEANWGATVGLDRDPGFVSVSSELGGFGFDIGRPIPVGTVGTFTSKNVSLEPPAPEGWTVGFIPPNGPYPTLEVTEYTDQWVTGRITGTLDSVPPTPTGQYYGDYLKVYVSAEFRLPRWMENCWTEEAVEDQRDEWQEAWDEMIDP